MMRHANFRPAILRGAAALLAWVSLPAPAASRQLPDPSPTAPVKDAAGSSAAFASAPFADAKFSVAIGAGGVPLNVVEMGDPAHPAIVFIHGFRQSYLSWSLQFKSDLKARCHIVAFDLRGHGNSGQPWEADAYDHGEPWADDLANVLTATGVSRPLIVAWSYGGNVAMDFARHHPQIPVSGYILVSTTAGTLTLAAPALGATPRPTSVANLTTNIRAVDSSTALLFPPTLDPALRDEFRAAAMRVSPFVDRAIARRAQDTNRDILSSIHAPVTFVFGGKDPIVNPTLAHAIATTFPGVTVLNFPDAGHAPFLEEAQRFDDILDRSQCRASTTGQTAEPTARSITHEQIEAAYATPDSRFITVDDVRIHYKDQGRGPAILLIHGSLGDTIDWDGWVRILAPRYRVIRIDLPGFGLSGAIPDGNYSIDRSLSLIDSLMDKLGIERFAIAGVSYGGPIAFRYAATRTERIDALVIMNSAGIEQGKQAVDPKTHAKVFYNTMTNDDAVTKDFVENALAHGFHDPALIPPHMVQRKLDMLNVVGRNVESARMVNQYVRGDPEQVLSHVRAPTLVLWGAAERSLSVSTVDRLVEALTHARSIRKVLIPGGDHLMHVEMATPTGTAVRDFLDVTVAR